MTQSDIDEAYGDLLFQLDEIRDSLQQEQESSGGGPLEPALGAPTEPCVQEELEQAMVQRAVRSGEAAYNLYRERARRLQAAAGGGGEAYRAANSSARQAIDTFLSSLGDCDSYAAGPPPPPTGRRLPTSSSVASLGDVFNDDEPALKRIRRAPSSTALRAHPALLSRAAHSEAERAHAVAILRDIDAHTGGGGGTTGVESGDQKAVLSRPAPTTGLDIAATAIDGRPVTRCVCVDIGARDGARCVALMELLRDRYAASGASVRMFGLLVEYSSLAVAGAVQRAFEAGCLCVYVMCPGMTRDDHSAQLVRAAEENNAALRCRGIPVLGELCIYQGDVRANLDNICDTLGGLQRGARIEGANGDGQCVGLLSCHAALHAILSKALDIGGVSTLIHRLSSRFDAWACHVCEPSMPSGPAWVRGSNVHLRVPGWTSVELQSLGQVLCDALPGLAASAASMLEVPLSEMDAVIEHAAAPHSSERQGGGNSGNKAGDMVAPNGGVAVPAPEYLTTAQRLVDRFDDASRVVHSLPEGLCTHGGAAAGDTVLRVEACLGAELLLRVLFDVHTPRHVDVFKEHLSWTLRGDQLTVVDAEALRAGLAAQQGGVRVSFHHFGVSAMRSAWGLLRPQVFSKVGAPLSIGAPGATLDAAVAFVATRGLN